MLLAGSLLVGLVLAPHALNAAARYEPYAFTRFASTLGSPGSADGPGSAARFWGPVSVASDSAGNVYVADKYNDSIRKITPAGEVSTLAGRAGSYGNADGQGSDARFNGPTGVATDSVGNVYVADNWNHTIRKITPAGDVSTLAGKAGSFGSADGTGSAARFWFPWGVATDSAGNVYVSDFNNNTIRKVTPAGEVSTLAGLAGSGGSADGTGSEALFYGPLGIATDSAGNVYVADWHSIRKITPVGEVSTLAGVAWGPGTDDGTGSAAQFSFPVGVATDSAGNVYVADTYNNTIRKITPAGEVSTLAGLPGSIGSADGTGSAARFDQPWGVATDAAGNVYVADTYNNTIRKGIRLAQLSIVSDGSGGYFIRAQGSPNFTCQLQRAPGLSGPWSTNAPQTAAASGLIEFHDPTPPPGQGFYRTFQQ